MIYEEWQDGGTLLVPAYRSCHIPDGDAAVNAAMPHVHRQDSEWWRRRELRAVRLRCFRRAYGERHTSRATDSTAASLTAAEDPLLSMDPWAGKKAAFPFASTAPPACGSSDPWAHWITSQCYGSGGAPARAPAESMNLGGHSTSLTQTTVPSTSSPPMCGREITQQQPSALAATSGATSAGAQPRSTGPVGQSSREPDPQTYSSTPCNPSPPLSGHETVQQQPTADAATCGAVPVGQLLAIVGYPDAVANFARQLGFGVAFLPVTAASAPIEASQNAQHFDISAGAVPLEVPSYSASQEEGSCSSMETFIGPADTREGSTQGDGASPRIFRDVGCQAWIPPVRARKGRTNGRYCQTSASIIFSEFSDADSVNSVLSASDFCASDNCQVGDLVMIGPCAENLNPRVEIARRYGRVVSISADNALVKCTHQVHVHPDKFWVAKECLLHKGGSKRSRHDSIHGGDHKKLPVVAK